MVAEAKEAARKEAWAEAFKQGREQGKADLLAEVEIKTDYTPAMELINRFYHGEEEVPSQKVMNAPEQLAARAAAWRRFVDSKCWTDVRTALLVDSRRRMQELLQGRGDPEVHRQLIKFNSELLGLPEAVIRTAERYEGAGKPSQKG